MDRDIIDQILEGLKDERARVRVATLFCLEAFVDGIDLSIIREITAYLSDEDKNVRLAALFVLGQCNKSEVGDEIIIEIRMALKDEDQQVRSFASAVLSTLRFNTPEDRPILH